MNNSTVPRISPSLASVEGLRIPPTLDNTTSVSFVLTQEPGKLKPKDLKIAIEKNRAEKELRAAEQKKIREEGGGAGVLDLRGILAEERLNGSDGDPFKKQLREMAFLADVEDVDKLEIEKGFRISEDYLGANTLTNNDIDVVYQQRLVTDLHKRRSEWRAIQARQTTSLYSYVHPYYKAGAPADFAHETMNTISPLFDANRNDIWGKRMNTLRRFISLVGRWIIRERVTRRVGKITQLFLDHGATTKEQVKEFIEQENMLSKKRTGQAPKAPGTPSNAVSFEDTKKTSEGAAAAAAVAPATVASMVFSTANDELTRREINEATAPQLDEININSEMCRRSLFPQCYVEDSGGGSRVEIQQKDIKSLIEFDDRTFFQLKVQPEYQTLEYGPHSMPACTSLYFPPSYEDTPFTKPRRTGALEEYALIQPVDDLLSVDDFVACSPTPAPAPAAAPKITSVVTGPSMKDEVYVATVPENIPPLLAQLRSIPEEMPRSHMQKVYGIKRWPEDLDLKLDEEKEMSAVVEPIWLEQQEQWTAEDLDFTDPLAIRQFAMFGPIPHRIDTDADWEFRPGHREAELTYKHDTSLRTTLLNRGTFSTVNQYLLGGHLSLNRDPAPAPGPTLSDKYFPDEDRHMGGLHCWETADHTRAVWEKDADVQPLQAMQDKSDYLTDSESDDDDEYPEGEVSIKNVRKILKPLGAGKGEKEGEEEESAEEAYNERKETQVEMLIDRKRMELASTVLKSRMTRQDMIANRTSEVSSKSICPFLALPVQMPFHVYEEELYKDTERQMASVQTCFVEPPAKSKRKLAEEAAAAVVLEVDYTNSNYPYIQFSVTLKTDQGAAA